VYLYCSDKPPSSVLVRAYFQVLPPSIAGCTHVETCNEKRLSITHNCFELSPKLSVSSICVLLLLILHNIRPRYVRVCIAGCTPVETGNAQMHTCHHHRGTYHHTRIMQLLQSTAYCHRMTFSVSISTHTITNQCTTRLPELGLLRRQAFIFFSAGFFNIACVNIPGTLENMLAPSPPDPCGFLLLLLPCANNYY
jgi:hypothetical protein